MGLPAFVDLDHCVGQTGSELGSQLQHNKSGLSNSSGGTATRTSPTRLPAVEAILTALGFLEWLRTGDALELSRVCFTSPSAILFLDEAPFPVASTVVWSGILSWAAAICDSCRSCDSWLESRALPWLGLMPPSLALAGGVNTMSASLVELVACELLLEWPAGGR